MPLPRNEKTTEAIAFLGVIAPASNNAGAVSMTAFSMGNHQRVAFIISIATLANSSTIDAKVQAAATSGGSYTDVTGAAIVQVTSGTNPIVVIEVDAMTLQSAGQGPYLKLTVTVGTAAAVFGAIAVGLTPHYAPASDGNIANVKQLISV